MTRPQEARDTASGFLDGAYAPGTVSDPVGAPIDLSPHRVDRPAGEALRDLAIAEGATRTIEVGLALGISTFCLCQAVLRRGGRHVAVDPFQRESWNAAGL